MGIKSAPSLIVNAATSFTSAFLCSSNLLKISLSKPLGFIFGGFFPLGIFGSFTIVGFPIVNPFVAFSNAKICASDRFGFLKCNISCFSVTPFSLLPNDLSRNIFGCLPVTLGLPSISNGSIGVSRIPKIFPSVVTLGIFNVVTLSRSPLLINSLAASSGVNFTLVIFPVVLTGLISNGTFTFKSCSVNIVDGFITTIPSGPISVINGACFGGKSTNSNFDSITSKLFGISFVLPVSKSNSISARFLTFGVTTSALKDSLVNIALLPVIPFPNNDTPSAVFMNFISSVNLPGSFTTLLASSFLIGSVNVIAGFSVVSIVFINLSPLNIFVTVFPVAISVSERIKKSFPLNVLVVVVNCFSLVVIVLILVLPLIDLATATDGSAINVLTFVVINPLGFCIVTFGCITFCVVVISAFILFKPKNCSPTIVGGGSLAISFTNAAACPPFVTCKKDPIPIVTKVATPVGVVISNVSFIAFLASLGAVINNCSLASSLVSGNSAAAPKNTPALLAVIALSAKNGIGESTISATLSAVCPRKLLCSVGTPLPRVIKLASCSTLLNPSALAASAISISFSFLSTICLGVSFVTKRSNLPLIKLVTPPLSNFLTPVGSDTSFIILSLPGICPNSTKDFPPVLNINPAFKTLGSTTINPAALASAAVSNFNLGTNSDIISSCATIFCLAIKLF